MRSRSRMLICGLVSLVICMVAGDNRCPNPQHVELVDPNNHTVFNCWALYDCPDGHERSVKRGSVHPAGTDIECKLCPKEMFSSVKTNHTCIKCARCGYNKELSNCTSSQDRQCLSQCVSKKYYLNTTDGQCYRCSECCGSDAINVQPQCIVSSPFSIGTTIIGEKGATHCGMKASQKCGYLSTPQERESSSCQTTIIIIIALGISCFLLLCVIVWCYIKGRQSGRQSFLCCSLSLPPGDSVEMNHCVPFQKKLKVIPEGVKIDNLPHEAEEIICALDAKRSCCKGWYDVGRRLKVSQLELDQVKREDHREGGSPTRGLLSILGTRENVVSLREFVQVLGDIGRNDISRKLFDYYHEKQTVSESPV